jgi:hypothetical protein
MSDQFMSEEERAGWDEYIGDFVRDVFPVFAKHGVSVDAALIAFMVNRVRNVIAEPDDGEPWKN